MSSAGDGMGARMVVPTARLLSGISFTFLASLSCYHSAQNVHILPPEFAQQPRKDQGPDDLRYGFRATMMA